MGVGTRLGTEVVTHLFRETTPQCTTISVDLKNTYNRLRHHWSWHCVKRYAPKYLRTCWLIYGNSLPVSLANGHHLASSSEVLLDALFDPRHCTPYSTPSPTPYATRSRTLKMTRLCLWFLLFSSINRLPLFSNFEATIIITAVHHASSGMDNFSFSFCLFF